MNRLFGCGTATALILASGLLTACTTSNQQASKSMASPDTLATSEQGQSSDPKKSVAGEKLALVEEGKSGSTKALENAVGASVASATEPRTRLRRGGGSYKIGKPYKIRGRLYVPKDEPGYSRMGRASWYGPGFHGRMTANGEIFDQDALTAAHTTLPLPSYARVTNMKNGRSVVVRINDRGPYAHDRVADLSKKAATMLGFHRAGHTQIKLEYLGKAPLEGSDKGKLLASYSEDADAPAQLPGAAMAVAMAGQIRDGVEAVGNGVASIQKSAAKLLPGVPKRREGDQIDARDLSTEVQRERFGREAVAHPLGYAARPLARPVAFDRIPTTASPE